MYSLNAPNWVQLEDLPMTILDTSQAAKYLGLAKSTVQKMRVYGGGPRFLKLNRSVRYRTEDLDDWIRSNIVANTSERCAS